MGKLDAGLVEEVLGDAPQNVNLAIKGSVARLFLDSQGGAYKTASGESDKSTAAIAEAAKGFTVLVECWE